MNTLWKSNNGNDESFWEHEFNKHVSLPVSLGKLVHSMSGLLTSAGVRDWTGHLSFYLGTQVFQQRELDPAFLFQVDTSDAVFLQRSAALFSSNLNKTP